MPNEFVARNGIIALNNTVVTGSVTATTGFTGSLFGTASWAQNALTSSTSTNALTASSADNFVVRQSLTASNALITGNITAQTLVVSTISSSVVYSSGSNIFGNLTSNTQDFTGSVRITGSLSVTGRATINDLTGSLFGTASWALNFVTSSVTSASYAYTASSAVSSSYSDSTISASYAFTASSAVSAFTASSAVSASYVLNSVSSSYAFTASSAVSAAFAISAAYAPGGASLSGGATNYAAIWASATTLTTGSIFVTQSNVGIGTLTPTNRLQVSGSSNVMNVRGSGSAATSSIFTVDGAAGRLFSVNDSLSGSLFSVNTIAGLPVMEAFSDNTVRIGQYGQRALFVSQSRVGVGLENPQTNLHVSGTSGGVFEVDGRLAINAFYVSASGQIGLGTASPTALLHLTGSTGALLEIDGVNAYQVLYASASGLIGVGLPNPNSSLHVSGTTGGVFEVDGANAVTAFYVSSSGNIGIRTITPTSASLQVDGNVFAASFTGSLLGTSSFSVTASYALNAGSGGMPAYVSFNRRTGSYTLALTDVNNIVEMNSGSTNVLTVPSSSVVNFLTGSQITIIQYGAGQTSIASGSTNVFLRSANNWLKINARYGAVTLTKVGTDEWYVFGNLNA